MSAHAPAASTDREPPLTPRRATALPAGPVLRTFFNIASAWSLDRAQTMALIGSDSVSTYSAWKRDPDRARLRPDQIERASYVFGIYKALQVLLPRDEAADVWVHRPNEAPLFGGRPALERMTSGYVADLARVREHLDAALHR